MLYECIKAFAVESVDDNGFCIENKGEQIQKGSMWKLDEFKTTLTGAEIRLNDLTGLRWIEISRDRLGSHFVIAN
ncbi:hypothetical protein [Lacrimispora sp.]|uniref:hypothetical protein n=1 Tax=Lacrimispora sp. TaxID=2719234 RepID=UPI0028A7502E|nr:hypothetical protein [Lacrimispora sp.]